MSIIWATGNRVYYLNLLIRKIISNPDAIERILGRGKRKEGTDIVIVVFLGLTGQFRRIIPSYFCVLIDIFSLHLFLKSSLWLRVRLFFPSVAASPSITDF